VPTHREEHREAPAPNGQKAKPAADCLARHKVAKVESNQGPPALLRRRGFFARLRLCSDSSNSVAAAPLFSKIRPGDIIWPLGGSYSISGVSRQNWICFVRQSGETRMKKTIASVALSLALMSSTAMAEERGGDAALGALSGAVVLGPIGAVAGAVIGYTAGPSISHSWGLNRSSAPRHARRAASPDARVPSGDSQPVPNQSAPKDQAAPQAAAPARPSATTTASTAPPVQPLE